MQGNLFSKLEEYSPTPKHKPAQRALPAEPEILPPDRPAALDNPVAGLKTMSLFTEDDVAQALRIFETGVAHGAPLPTMREVMMFTLRVAAINLDVR